MTRSRRDLSAFAAVVGLALLATASADAGTVKRAHHSTYAHARQAYPRDDIYAYRRAPLSNFPVYIDRGSDYNPGSDNLYFSDTKTPHYIVGPAWFQRWNN